MILFGGYILMQKEIKPNRIIIMESAAFFISVGALFVLDRLYEITYKAYWAGVIGKANDSVWEQTKIAFFSFFVLSLIELFLVNVPFMRFLVAKNLGMLFITLALPGFLYGYSGASGLDFKAVDITGAIIILLLAFVISCRTMLHKTNNKRFIISFICFVFLLSCFLSLTVYAPDIPFFKDSETGTVGLDNHLIYVSSNTSFT